MIVPGSALRIVVATRPVDFRKGHDGLAAVVEHELGLDRHSGVVVVFRGFVPSGLTESRSCSGTGRVWCSPTSGSSRGALRGRRCETG